MKANLMRCEKLFRRFDDMLMFVAVSIILIILKLYIYIAQAKGIDNILKPSF